MRGEKRGEEREEKRESIRLVQQCNVFKLQKFKFCTQKRVRWAIQGKYCETHMPVFVNIYEKKKVPVFSRSNFLGH